MKFNLKIDAERCKGCELCVSVCRNGVLAMCGRLNSRGIHFATVRREAACDGCRRCADICPDAAIEIDLIEEATEKPRARQAGPGVAGGVSGAPRRSAVMAK